MRGSRAYGAGWIAAGLALLAGCQTGPRVEVDRVASADLERYQTFALSDAAGSAGDPAFGPSAREVAERALVAAFRERGLSWLDAGHDPAEADLVVSIAITHEARALPSAAAAYAWEQEVGTRQHGLRTPLLDVPLGAERSVVTRPSTRVASGAQQLTRTLVVDVFESGSRRHLWRGRSAQRWSPREIDPRDLETRLRAIVAKYPRLAPEP